VLDTFEVLRQRRPRHSAAELCRWIQLPYSTLRRWRTRRRRGEPLIRKPGPKKIPELPVAEFRSRVARLAHRNKRSRGVGQLHAEFGHALSRRAIDAEVAEARDQHKRQHREQTLHIQWLQPNLVWAIDACKVKTDKRDPGHVVVLARDLASHFHFDPLVLPAESAEQNTAWLAMLFTHHQSPLFLKRDNGSPFNELHLEDFLAEQCVLPLNSPAYYPPYNGAIEHGVGSFKREIRSCLDPDRPVPALRHFMPLVRAITHQRNDRPRRSLGGRCPSQVYFQSHRTRWNRPQRLETFEWISAQVADTLKANREKLVQRDVHSAWRNAALSWLRCQGLISITQNNKLLPHFEHQNRS